MKKFESKFRTAVTSIDQYAAALDGSHAALYRGLGHCYDLYLDAKQSPDTFITFADKELDLRVTGQAVEPLALLVIKCVFKNLSEGKYDHRRKHGRWSLGLAHMAEVGVPVEAAETYLGDGGVDKCVERYHTAHKPACAKNAVAKKKLPLISNDNISSPATENTNVVKFAPSKGLPRQVLLLGEVSADGTVTVIEVVEDDEAAVTAFLNAKASSNQKEVA